MAKPARPELIFHSIDEMIADAQRLKAGPYEKAGQWDLAMILDHLARAMETPPSNQRPVPWPFNIVARGFIHQMAKR
jgi:hypothetical protein